MVSTGHNGCRWDLDPVIVLKMNVNVRADHRLEYVARGAYPVQEAAIDPVLNVRNGLELAVGGMFPERVVLPDVSLREVLRRACAERGVSAVERSTWIDHMVDELYDVEVETARDFLLGNWTVNSRLET